MGHSDDLGGRLYSRTKNSHSKLTNRIIHDTLHLCENWAGLLGFGSDEPQRVSGEDMWAKAHGVAYQEERDLVKVVKELLTVLTAPSRSSQNASDKPYLTVTGIQPALQVNNVELGCASPVQALRSPVNNTHLPAAVLDDQDEPNSQDDILPDGPWLVGDEINPPLMDELLDHTSSVDAIKDTSHPSRDEASDLINTTADSVLTDRVLPLSSTVLCGSEGSTTTDMSTLVGETSPPVTTFLAPDPRQDGLFNTLRCALSFHRIRHDH